MQLTSACVKTAQWNLRRLNPGLVVLTTYCSCSRLIRSTSISKMSVYFSDKTFLSTDYITFILSLRLIEFCGPWKRKYSYASGSLYYFQHVARHVFFLCKFSITYLPPLALTEVYCTSKMIAYKYTENRIRQ